MKENISLDKHKFVPRVIAWELTRRCKLNCRHCRAAAADRKYNDELDTQQCMALLDNIAGFASPVIILTGGEPLLRDDIYQIADYGHRLGLRMVLATCGVFMDDKAAQKMLQVGIRCISLSLDGASSKSHDNFRRIEGAFEMAIKAAEVAHRNGLAFQINTTVTRSNIDELGDIMKLAEELGAVTFNPFLLVPTGRGKEMADEELSAQQYEETLQWLSKQQNNPVVKIAIRVTCAPHYQRIIQQAGTPEPPAYAAGCMGGKSFAFISHTGKVQICGFLDIVAGDLRANNIDFADVWRNSPFLQEIRSVNDYKGKCGYCEYRYTCGGCRARAYALTGDYMASEPFCVYQPR